MTKHTKHINAKGVSQKQPKQGSKAVLSSKRTIDRGTPRPDEIQKVENTYEFFTRQRPFAWEPYTFTGSETFQDTSGFSGQTISFQFDTIPSRKSLIINYFEVGVHYLPYGNLPLVNYTIRLDDPFTLTRVVDPATGQVASFGLTSSTEALYHARTRPDFSTFVTGRALSDFTMLNTNVLDFGNDGGTSLFVSENADLRFTYSCPINPLTLVDIVAYPDAKIINLNFTVRGHLINVRDYDTLKVLNERTDILGLLK
jgi:hypothetical protein